jgi:hypothetical protein
MADRDIGKAMYRVSTPGRSTDRSSLDLLTLPMPFTQVPILEPDDVVREMGRRGVRLDLSLLEDLHRHRVLIPFYRVRSAGSGSSSAGMDTSRSRIPNLPGSGLKSRLVIPARDGRVSDPASESFEVWPRSKPGQIQPDSHNGYYYSRHQLLILEEIRSFVDLRDTVFVGQGKRVRTYQQLSPTDMPEPGYERACAEWRSLAIALSDLDTHVWPEIMRVISWPDAWRAVRAEFKPNQELEWLGMEAADATRLADRLLTTAGFLDMTGEFYELIRRARPDSWDSLSGQVLSAHDLRIGAEILARIVGQVEGSPFPPHHQNQPLKFQRLSTRPSRLEEVLTRTELSPHPSLVVVVEGATELTIFPKVMETLGTPLQPDWIRVENRGGIDTNVQLMAQYAVRPLLGVDRGDFVLLDRPPVRLYVIADPEKDYASVDKRKQHKRSLLDAITKEIPPDLHSDLRSPSTRLVTITVWPKYPFEFAHFRNGELADGLLAIASAPYPGGKEALVARLAVERSKLPATRRRPGPSVEAVWKEWISDYGLSKPTFAEQMWPILEAKIRAAMTTSRGKPPIMKAAMKAYELAQLPRSSTALVRHHRRARD